MKKNKINKDDRLIMSLSEIPIEGNLGLLAYGDIAFVAWREVKKTSKKDEDNEKE